MTDPQHSSHHQSWSNPQPHGLWTWEQHHCRLYCSCASIEGLPLQTEQTTEASKQVCSRPTPPSRAAPKCGWPLSQGTSSLHYQGCHNSPRGCKCVCKERGLLQVHNEIKLTEASARQWHNKGHPPHLGPGERPRVMERQGLCSCRQGSEDRTGLLLGELPGKEEVLRAHVGYVRHSLRKRRAQAPLVWAQTEQQGWPGGKQGPRSLLPLPWALPIQVSSVGSPCRARVGPSPTCPPS